MQNQPIRSQEIRNFTRHLMRKLNLSESGMDIQKEREERINQEFESVHIGYSD